MIRASRAFVPVFIDTLGPAWPYERFGEQYGSYPVLRVHDHESRDVAGRLDGNKVAGQIPKAEVLAQMERGLAAFGG